MNSLIVMSVPKAILFASKTLKHKTTMKTIFIFSILTSVFKRRKRWKRFWPWYYQKKKKKGKSTHHGWGKEEQRGRWQRNSSSSGTRERNACPVRIYFPLLVYPRENSQLFNLLTQNSSLFLNKYFQFWHFYTRESNLSCLYTESTISEAYCLVSIYNSDISVPKIIHFHVFLLIHQ